LISSSFALLDTLPVPVYVTDADGCIVYYNDAAAELWGRRPQIGSVKWNGAWKLFSPDGTPLQHDEGPLAQTLRTGEPVRGATAIAERPDGTRVIYQPYPTQLRDADGNVTGAINVMTDITERFNTEVELAKLAAIVISSDDAIISKTLMGRITSWNAGATRIFGFEPDEIIGQHITRIVPPELHEQEEQILAKLRRGERVDHFETVRVAKNGRRIDISLSVSPIRDQWGNIVGAAKVARDITERKKAERLQQLLVEELNHRVKNTLAIVQAIATQSASRANSPREFAASFGGRIQALARTHTLLSRTSFEYADIGEIVRDQVLLGSEADKRVSLSGPLLTLDRQSSVHLSLILHELATNARKYGALSKADGELSISWRLRSANASVLLIEWRESGGPTVTASRNRGFGTTLIEETLRARGGDATLHYAAAGFSCELQLPLPQDWYMAQQRYPMQNHSPEWSIVPKTQRSPLEGRRIIIVEDEPLILMDMEQSLSEAGAEIAGTAGNLDAAKDLVSHTECDAALLDTNLSGERVEELAMTLTRRNIPFAFVTGYGRDALPEGFREGVLLNKPFSPEQLAATLEMLLRRGADVVAFRRDLKS